MLFIVAWALLLCLHSIASAEERFTRLGVDDGLPNATIYSVQQDRTGFLWLGSTNSGLLRFDGYRFVEFPVLTTDELALHQTPDVGVVLIDSTDSVWAGSWGLGLSKLSQQTAQPQRFTAAQGLAGDQIQALLEDKQGRIWVGTTAGLSRINKDNSVTAIGAKGQQAMLADQRIWSLEQAADGVIWIGTSAGLHAWHDETGLSAAIELIKGADSLNRGNEIRALQIIGTHLWVGSRQGVFKFDMATQQFVAVPVATSGRPEPLVNALALDRNNQTLLIGSYNGLHRLTLDNSTVTDSVLSNVNVRSILQDRSGVLWLGSRESGLYRNVVSSSAFDDISSVAPGLAQAEPFSVTAVLRQGNTLWLGSTEAFYRIQLDDGQVQRIQTDSRVNALALAPENTLYIATDLGLLRFDPSTDSSVNISQPFELASVSNRNVRDLKIAADGTLYLGMWGEGIIVWQPEQRSVKRWLPQLSQQSAGNAVQQLFLGTNNQLWVATRYSGLFQIDVVSEKVVQHSVTQRGTLNLPHNNVLCVSEHAGILAICSRDGLLLYDQHTATQQLLTRQHGLPSDTVLGVVQQDDKLWVMTASGLGLRPAGVERFMHYNSADGMVGSELNTQAFFVSDEHIYFGTIAGLVVVKPELLHSNQQMPRSVLSAIVVDHQQLQIKPHAAPWPLIALSSDNHTINFEFSALDYQDPQRNQFHYKLEGIDRDWVMAGARNSAFYANLPAGSYPLWLKASNNHGVFSEPEVVANLQVLPAWWQRAPVLYSAVICLALILWLMHQYRLRHIRQINRLLQAAVENKAKAQLILETRVAERTQALEQSSLTLSLRTRQLERSLTELAKTNQELKRLDTLKDEFIATVSHELRTPLTAIRGAIGLVAQNVVTPENPLYQNMLQTAQINSERLSQLINDLLDLQKFATGTFTLNFSQLNVSHLVQQAIQAMQPYARRYQVELILEGGGTADCWVHADALRLRQVVDNLISNAVKFSPAAATVVVRVSRKAEQVRVEVEDHGTGIPVTFQQRIFEKFSQADSSDQRAKEGSGLGLAICKKIIENHQGHIGFSTEPGQGSTFWFSLQSTTISHSFNAV